MPKIIKSATLMLDSVCAGDTQSSIAPRPEARVIKQNYVKNEQRAYIAADYFLAYSEDTATQEKNSAEAETSQAREDLALEQSEGDSQESHLHNEIEDSDFAEQEDSAPSLQFEEIAEQGEEELVQQALLKEDYEAQKLLRYEELEQELAQYEERIKQEAIEKAEQQALKIREKAERTIAEAERLEADAKSEADTIIASAEEAAEKIVKSAQEKGVDIQQDNRNKGYLEGFDTGYNDALAEYGEKHELLSQRLKNAIEAVTEYEKAAIKQSELDIIEIAVAIASKLVAGEIKQSPDVIVRMVREAVMQNSGEEFVRITISDELLPIDTKASEDLIKKLRQLGNNITVMQDFSGSKDTIQVESPKGILDMNFSTQINNIKNAIFTK